MSAPSAQQLVFEGPDPERLLLEAWSIHGTQVRISEPVRIRRGGVLGFFAKLHYRIEVVPTVELTPTIDATRLQAPMLEERLEERDVTAAVPVIPAMAARVGQPAGRATPIPGRVASPLEALLEATEDEVDLASSRRASFDEILDKVASSLGDDPAALSARLPAEPAERAVITERAAAPLPAEASPAPRGRHLRSAALDRPVLEPRPWSPTPRPWAPPPRPGPAGAPSPIAEELRLVGFPPALLECAGRAPRSLHDAFSLARSPRPLPRTPGSLVAVVGSTQVARRLAELCGVPAVELARARRFRAGAGRPSPRTVHDADEAADLAPGWRRDRVAVVAVAIASVEADGPWAREVLRALAPSMTVVVASATTKPEDIAATCAAIGTADALVLEDVEATLTPAAALAAGIPIGMLDGLPADAGNWVAVASRALARRGTRC